MANQDVRYYLNGLLLNICNCKLNWLHPTAIVCPFMKTTLDQGTGYEARIILPRKAVLELSRLLDDPDVELKIEFSSNNIRIFIKNLIFSSKLMDSKFPDFGKVFQQDFFNPIHIQKQF